MKSKIQFLMAIAFMLIASVAYAQVPQMFNYQGIARDAKGNPLSNQKMSLKLSVLPTSDATVPEYEETQLVSTNEFGLYTLQIGNGTPVTGEMKTVKWETGNKYIKVAIDPTGGTNYADAGTNQLLSVPYAIYADKAGVAAGGNDKTRTGAVNSNAAHVAGDANYITKFTALNTIGKSLLYDNGTSIGLGTTTPPAGIKLHMVGNGGYENIRMQNNDPLGYGKFTMYNDNVANYATFTKYGSNYSGGYPGVSTQYPYANLLTFGNNNGAFLMSTSGNIGIATFNGTTNLKFNAHVATGYLGLGGPFTPAANVHFNNNATGDTVKITSNTTGHTATDGLDIRLNGAAAEIILRENANLDLGTNHTSRMTITNGGNVGIGTNLPSYKVDVLHGGATGIRSKSSATFSVVDIDAFNGDAALRFQENGVGRWNTRNQPGTNDYEIFQLSGGGQRMIINSTTGNVGIGTSTPLNKVDVSGGLGVGAGYAGTNTAPTNGAIIEGNVGIGTSTPSSKLHVVGNDSRFDNNLFQIYDQTGANYGFFVNPLFGGDSYFGTGFGYTGNLHTYLGSTTRMTYTQAGPIGIGNTNPITAALEIDDSTQARVLDVVGTGTGIVGQTMNLSRNFAPGSFNDMLQISVPAGSPDDFQFIECDRGGANSFVVDGNGAVTFANALQPGGSAGSAGQVLRSAGAGATPTWVNSNTMPGTIAFMGSTSGSTATPTATASFLSNSRVAVTITSATQVVQITTTVTLGSTAVGGANGLSLYPAYNSTNAATPVVALGGQSLGLSCAQNTRNHYTLSYTVSGLTPGTYYFGMGGNSSSPNWTNNEYGYTSVMVMNN